MDDRADAPRPRSDARSGPRPWDVVLYGASGFVGRQTVAWFAEHGGGLRWALGGRSAERLAAAREAAGPGAADAGLVIADGTDAAAIDRLAAGTRIVLSTAGPFARHGDALVDACVTHRTHYVDITGETPWVRRLIDRHHARAAADGTRIVPCCGFDSVPSDLGAWHLAHRLRQSHGEACVRTSAAYSMRGGLNGGTIASALAMHEAGEQAAFDDPFLLSPAGAVPADRTPHRDPVGSHRDPDFDEAWLGPFVMGPVNTRVVRRTAALLSMAGDPAYSRGYAYQEYQRLGRGPFAAVAGQLLAAGGGALRTALRHRSGRALLRRIAPAPGEGPSERAMDEGSFRWEGVARGEHGTVVRGRIAFRGDPGNRATTAFVCEAALALARDADALPERPGGGVLTPATAFGAVLLRRLAAIGMDIRPSPPDVESSAY